MKKILVVAFLITLVLSVACQAGGNSEGKNPGTEPEEVVDLETLLTKIIEDSGKEAMLEESFSLEALNQEEAGYLIGSESFEGAFEEGLSLQPMINVHPFALGIFRLAEEGEAEAFAKELKEKADLGKWICVRAETMTAATKGSLVLFVMGDSQEVNSITQASGFTPIK